MSIIIKMLYKTRFLSIFLWYYFYYINIFYIIKTNSLKSHIITKILHNDFYICPFPFQNLINFQWEYFKLNQLINLFHYKRTVASSIF